MVPYISLHMGTVHICSIHALWVAIRMVGFAFLKVATQPFFPIFMDMPCRIRTCESMQVNQSSWFLRAKLRVVFRLCLWLPQNGRQEVVSFVELNTCGYMWTFIPLLATSTAWWIIRVSASTYVLTPVIVSHSCIAITSSRPTLSSWPSDNQQSGKQRCGCLRGQHISPCVQLNDFSSGHPCLLLDFCHLVPQIAPPDDASMPVSSVEGYYTELHQGWSTTNLRLE